MVDFYQRGRFTGAKNGLLNPRVVRIVEGTCKVRTETGATFDLKSGDIWFVPKSLPHSTHWESDGLIRYEVLEFDADVLSFYYKTMQVLRIPEAERLFEGLKKAQDGKTPYASLGAVCAILDAVLPYLEKTENDHLERVLPAIKYIDEHFAEEIDISALASLCHLCVGRFYEVFRLATGFSPLEYKNRAKLSRAAELVRGGRTNEEICEILNYSSPSYFRRMMKKHLGVTPKELKKKQGF